MSEEVIVLSRTQIINVEPAGGRVSVTNAGPPGPPGADGGGGDSLWESDGDLHPISDTDSVSIYSPEQIELTVSGSGNTLFIDTQTGADIQILSDQDAFIQGYDGGVVLKAGHGGASVDPGEIKLIASDDIGITAGVNLGLSSSGNINITPGHSGDITIGDPSGNGNIIASSFNGNIELRLVGSADLYLGGDANNGNLEMVSDGGDIRRTSVGGSIQDITQGGNITHETDSGNIAFITNTGLIIMSGLPTSPGFSDTLYVDGSGFLKVSP